MKDGRISVEEAVENIAQNMKLLYEAMESAAAEQEKPKVKAKVETKVSERSFKTFQKHANQLIKYLNDEHHPHTSIIITPTSAEVVVGVAGFSTDGFVKD
jgi:long-subunit acyl-CoA synthetase (AMP-forming)